MPADPSWWFADAMALEAGQPPSPALSGEITVDVAIVGGGYTGLWTALALKARRPSLSIALIEARLCGSGASGKTGAKVHGYWSSLQGMSKSIGDDAALAVARAGAICGAGRHPRIRQRAEPRCLVARGRQYPRLRGARADTEVRLHRHRPPPGRAG